MKGNYCVKSIDILDCTLRDGGYCNQWKFGYDNIKRIISGLQSAGIDIIECGFITTQVKYVSGVTKFTSIDQIAEFLPQKREGKLYVAMMNYGDYDSACIPEYDGTSIDGIRIAFHKKDWKDALHLCKKIKEKGYLVFIQPMVSLSYMDEEFLEMIEAVNDINPYAFYIVDSFGEMKQNDLMRLYYLVDHNLKDEIRIGFHSHNNLQLSYSNAVALVNMHSKRKIIIDASVYGMGRGAGNLNTELFVEHLNNDGLGDYCLSPLLSIIDGILNHFHEMNFWGYSLPNYISAKHHTHPNYAFYLDEKKTLTVESMNRIFDMLDPEKRANYDQEYIEKVYLEYMSQNSDGTEGKTRLTEIVKGKKILLIAPGKSSLEEKNKIIAFAKNHDVLSVSINYDYPYSEVDFVFVSNMRRYRELSQNALKKSIVTSNLKEENAYLKVGYRELLSDVENVKDNAGMMAIRLFMNCGVKEIYLAGLDGYSQGNENNYCDTELALSMNPKVINSINKGISQVITEYANKVQIHFLTTPKHIVIG